MEPTIIGKMNDDSDNGEGDRLINFEDVEVQADIRYASIETPTEYGKQKKVQDSKETTTKQPDVPTDGSSIAGGIASRSSELWGCAIIFASAFFLGVAATAIRFSQTNYSYDPFQTVNLIGTQITIYSTLYIVFFSSFKKVFSNFTYGDYFRLIIRGIVGALTICCFSFSLGLLPSGYAISIFYTGPIITVFLSSIMLSERPALSAYLASLISFVGVLLVSHQSTTSKISMLGVSVGLLAAIFGAMIPITVRALVSSAHFITSPFSLGVACFVITLCLGRYVSLLSVLRNGSKDLIIASLLPGFSAFFGQFILGIGFQFCKASTGSVIRTLEIPTAYISAVLMLHENPNPVRVVGSMVILIATVMVTMGKVYGF